MKFKIHLKNFIIYNVVLLIMIGIFHKIRIIDNIIRYIKYETIVFKFQDLLSITITILSIFVGAVITVATVLISMCDKRIIKLIQRNNKAAYLVECIKVSIITGMISIILLAAVYAKLDFDIYIIRIIILYLVIYLLIIFIVKSRLLIKVVFSILNDAFKESDNFIVDGTFKVPNNKNIKKNHKK